MPKFMAWNFQGCPLTTSEPARGDRAPTKCQIDFLDARLPSGTYGA
jgi:hypothetical protein